VLGLFCFGSNLGHKPPHWFTAIRQRQGPPCFPFVMSTFALLTTIENRMSPLARIPMGLYAIIASVGVEAGLENSKNVADEPVRS